MALVTFESVATAAEAYNSRVAEQAAQARLESAARELANANEQTKSAKADAAEAKKHEREAMAELKTLRAKVAEIPRQSSNPLTIRVFPPACRRAF